MKQSAISGIGKLLIALSLWAPTASAATDAEKQAAIRRGLDYLYKTQQPEGFWSYAGNQHSATGAASFALISQQDKWDAEAANYQAAVDKAIAYLLKDAVVSNLRTRDDGINVCPGGEAVCKGIVWSDGGDTINTTGMVA